MRWCFLLLFPAMCFAKSFITDDFTFSYNGTATYTFATDDSITDQHIFAGLVNLSLSNQYGYVSAQVTTNEFNHVRRLLLAAPLVTFENDQIVGAVGRLTNSIGFINTNSNNPKLNNTVLLPLTTYDTRRYENLPDVTDGVQLAWSHTGEISFNVLGYAGNQVVDNNVIPVYGNNMSIIGNSKQKFGFDFALYYEQWKIHYAYTNTQGKLIGTIPDFYFRYMQKDIIQDLHFGGVSYNWDQWEFQTEVAYRNVNLVTPVIGAYSLLKYNITDKNDIYVGYSYGKRFNEDSRLHDLFFGYKHNIDRINISIEQHITKKDNWYYQFNQELHQIDPLTLVSITYCF